jgi:hypothetical protein
MTVRRQFGQQQQVAVSVVEHAAGYEGVRQCHSAPRLQQRGTAAVGSVSCRNRRQGTRVWQCGSALIWSAALAEGVRGEFVH